MAIPEILQLSQSALQDYDDCRRRYYYRYVLHQSWPADVAQPAREFEKLIKNGKDFHTIVHQYFSGIPRDLLEKRNALQGELEKWWDNFLMLHIVPGSYGLYPEKLLSTRIAETKLVAKYDLLSVNRDGELTIYDWKTTKRKPDLKELINRWQTRLYLFTAAMSGGILLDGDAIEPENCRLIYWFANFPSEPIEIKYSNENFEEDRIEIRGIIEDIQSRRGIDLFDLTVDEQHCKYCVYRSLCERGQFAGLHPDFEYDASIEFSLDFDQIEEIEF
jgi:CRISPR/Cas system-associated exonuclease Cas4 (RecB family)